MPFILFLLALSCAGADLGTIAAASRNIYATTIVGAAMPAVREGAF